MGNVFIFLVLGFLIIFYEVRAEVGIVETTANISMRTGTNLTGIPTNIFTSSVGGGGNPRWSGLNLGQFDLNGGAFLFLENFYFENYAFNGGGTPPGGLTNDNWLSTDSTATFKLYRDNFLIRTLSMRQSSVAGNNRNWDLGANGVSINILDGLVPAEPLGKETAYGLSWTIDWNYNQWIGSMVVGNLQTTSGGNAVFSTIPEPSGSLLMGLGLAGLAIFRRICRNS